VFSGGKEPLNTSELIKDLARVKRKQAPLWEHMHRVNHPAAVKVRGCGSYLELREWLDHDGQCTVQTANFCKKAVICNLCAIRRSAKLCKAYEAKILEILSRPDSAHLKPVMLTFTIRNRDELHDGFEHLKSSLQKLMKKANNWKQRKTKPEIVPEFVKVLGGVRSFEIKMGKGGRWHPHAHIFALLDDWIDQEKLSQEWLEITGDSFVVGVTACKGGILKGLIEVLKYTTKFGDMTPAQILEVAEETRNAQLSSPFGILRNVKVEEIDHDEQLDGDFIDYIAHFLYSKNGYKLKRKGDVHEDVTAEGERRMEEEKRILKRSRQC
jgi:hypothetical protein